MNRPLDYDDQTIRATPYETLSDYRSTVSLSPAPSTHLNGRSNPIPFAV